MAANRRSVKGNEGNWVEMQDDTFKNWVNANLKQRDMYIETLEEGFEDGTKLVNLFEIVSKKGLGRYAKNPKFPNQKLENVALVLKAMENDGVKLVSIDSDHVVNGNAKMILGLIWQLILRYQIGGTEDKSVKIALKKLLLIWLQHVIPEQQIKNLTTNWNSGVALCNLINVLQPGLCPEYNHMDRDAGVSNAAKGMQIAEDKLGIPQIISPDHMASKNVDELSMMTYLSYFTQDNGVGEQWTKNLVNKWNPNLNVTNFNTDWNDGSKLGMLVETCAPSVMPDLSSGDSNVDKCKLGMDTAEQRLSIPKIISADEMSNPKIPELAIMAYTVQFTKVKRLDKQADKFSASGPGIIEPQIGSVNEFFVRSEENYPFDDMVVEVIGPNNDSIPVAYENTSEELRKYKYSCDEPGNYKINVKYKGDHIPKSPILATAQQDLNMIRVHGDGLAGAYQNVETEFTVDVGSRNSRVGATVDGPSGTSPPAVVTNNNNGTYTVRYTPVTVGTHRIYLDINGQKLPGGAIETQVSNPDAVSVSSMQYEEDKQLYAELHERIGIAVDTSNSGPGTLSAQTVGPNNQNVDTDVDNEEGGSYTVSFTPTEIGEYHTNVYWSGKPIQGSPFVVWVSDPNMVIASGDSLYQSRIYEESTFEINSENAGPGHISAYAECNGKQTPVEVDVRQDKLYDCKFTPSEVGIHYVHVNYNNVPIRNSPFKVMVGNPKEVLVVANSETVVETSESHSMLFDVPSQAGAGDLHCVVKGPNNEDVSSHIRDTSGTGKEIIFTPETPGRYEVYVRYAGGLLHGCPYIVNVNEAQTRVFVDASRVRVAGDGLRRGYVNELCRVNVDASEAGAGRLTAIVEGLKHDVVVGIRDNNNGTYEVTYTPPKSGAYVLAIQWDEQHVDGSPFRVNIDNKAEPESVVVEGSGIKEGTAGQPVLFTLDGRKAGPGQLSCRCRAPSGKMTYVLISDNKDGTYTVDLNATEPGLHTVEVEWDGQPIPGSPFLVRIMQAPDVKKVRAHGPGLESGTMDSFNGTFQVDSKGAGPGTLKVRIHGPRGAFKVEMFRDNPKDRIINVRYNPTEPGIYTANVFWSDEHVEGSPFEVFVGENEQHLDKWRRNKIEIQRQEGLITNGY